MIKNEINSEDIKFSDVSFMDPNGRVFTWNNNIYRGLYKKFADDYIQFINTDLCQQMMTSGRLIPTSTTNFYGCGFTRVLQHEKIAIISYCLEWVPQMLKSAALLTIELAEELLSANKTLSDAYPWNIVFRATTPVFIDFSSVVSIHKEYLWIAYQQYCNFFYHPLMLSSCGHAAIVRRLLTDYSNGISSTEVSSLLSPLEKLSLPGYISRVTIPQRLSKFINNSKYEDKLKNIHRRVSTNISNNYRKKFFTRLRKNIENIRLPTQSSHWDDYYHSTNNCALVRKKQLFKTVLNNLQPKTLLDIGSNTGEFSIIAAKHGCNVIAIDNDEASVSRLYTIAHKNSLNIQPLIIDILNPTPSFGWCAKQFTSAQERFSADLVCAFALIHHLIFTHGNNFYRAIAAIRSFQRKYALIEYIDKTDSMSVRLQRRIGFDDSWYTKNNFIKALHQQYSKVEEIGSVTPTRMLYLCKI